ncbi:MAG: helix-turn-helix domain-containing protein [Psychrosphaera sp.]|nr:helix-turn-helix domain-containing protein [Psychrosphaera sp.]
MYHYTECGLQNIHLVNGFNKAVIEGEEYVSVDYVYNLHRVIAKCIINNPTMLATDAFKFLRIELDLSQKSLGGLLGVDTQTIARWEKGQTAIPRTADVALRAYYIESIDEQSNVGFLLKMLADTNTQEIIKKIILNQENEQWLQQAA